MWIGEIIWLVGSIFGWGLILVLALYVGVEAMQKLLDGDRENTP